MIHLVGVIPEGIDFAPMVLRYWFGDQAVRVRQVNEEAGEYHWSGHQWIEDDRPSEPFSLTQVFAKPTFWSVSSLYLSAGFLHIVPKGLDHILFILGIFLMSMQLRPLVLQVTMFTIAPLADTVTRYVWAGSSPAAGG